MGLLLAAVKASTPAAPVTIVQPPIPMAPIVVVEHDDGGLLGTLAHIAPLVTAGIAGLALYIAWSQLRLARDLREEQARQAQELREEQARPYVVVGLRAHTGYSNLIALYVTNLGKTAAYNVRLSFDKAPTSRMSAACGKGGRAGVRRLAIPDPFAVLVPEQTWTATWDTTHGHADLPQQYTVTVNADDSKGRALDPLVYVLDWEVLAQGDEPDERTLHHVVDALRDIARRLPSR